MNKKHDFWEYSFKLASLQHYNTNDKTRKMTHNFDSFFKSLLFNWINF